MISYIKNNTLFAFALFLKLCDVVFTTMGINKYGMIYERNPFVSYSINVLNLYPAMALNLLISSVLIFIIHNNAPGRNLIIIFFVFIMSIINVLHIGSLFIWA